MSELTKLLDGVNVEWRAIDDYIAYLQPTKYLVKSKNYNNDFETPVLTAGKTFILGYTDEIDGIYKAKIKPVIIFDDFTTANKWVDFDFKAKSSAMKILVVKDENRISLKYFFYLLNSLPSELVAGDHKRQWISNYANKLIPIPCPENPEKSLKIQQEIVRILDRLSEETNQLTAALQKELEIHQKQYNFYREELFKFEGQEVEWKSLGEAAENLDAMRQPVKSGSRDLGEIPYYGASGIVDYVKDYIFEGDFLLISEDGANLLSRSTPIAFSISGKSWVNNHAHILKFETHSQRRLIEYYLNSIDLEPYITGAAQPKLNQKNLNKIKVPVLKSLVLESTVKILDDLDAETKAITKAIQKEIALRNKQYEYYRDRLLSFQSLQTEAEAIQ